MSTFERLEGDLPMLLEELAPPRTPDYLESVYGRTARASQRPAWTFPERWLPVSALTQRMATAPRVPRWAVVLAALLLLVLAILASALFVGSQQRRVPAPFGRAGNGLIAYGADGDIYVGDPVTGTSRLLVGGPAIDGSPGFSPDGTRLAFLRAAAGGRYAVDLYTVLDDGSGLLRVNTAPLDSRDWINWAPDSRRFVVGHQVGQETHLDLMAADGTGAVTTLATADRFDTVSFRPPDGQEILYRALAGGQTTLYTVGIDGSNRRLIAEAEFDDNLGLDLSNAVYSADGSRILYQVGGTAANPDDGCCRLWVMNADGSNAHEFIPPPGRAWDGVPSVSPDGTRVAYWHHPNDASDPAAGRVSVARADGAGTPVVTGPKVTGNFFFAWTPDSTRLLFHDESGGGTTYLLDPDGGPWTTITLPLGDAFDWQRIAPGD